MATPRVPGGEGAEAAEVFENLRRPLTYASKDDFANLDKVLDLHNTIAQMVGRALETVEDPAVIDVLRKIAKLFLDFEDADRASKQERIREALALLSGTEPKKKKKRRRRRRRKKKSTGEAEVASTEVDSEPEEKAEPEPEPEPETEAASEPEPEPEPEAKSEREPEPKKTVQVDVADARKRLQRLQAPVTRLKGVGPKMSEALERMGVLSIGDLLLTLPRDYQDRRQIVPIADVEVGEVHVVAGEIVDTQTVGYPRKIFTATIRDESGELQAKWFNYSEHAAKKWEAGQRVVLCGKVDEYKGDLQVAHPDIEIIESPDDALAFARVVPVYPLTEGVTQNAMRKFVRLAMEEYSAAFVSGVPESVRESLDLPDPVDALRQLHIPSPDADIAELTSSMSPWHRSLAFDELFVMQLSLALKRREASKRRGISFEIHHKPLAQFRDVLPFELTAAQERVIDDIKRDMFVGRPMRRLVQGDVGSGKTVVAMMAAIIAASNERQVAFMAPTEVVAEQHYAKARVWLERIGMKVALLTGSIRPTERDGLYPRISRGKIEVVIGTHALISEGVTFKKLGLVIIDEQHRFGVEQRARLAKKGAAPDVLFLTATPIPRSLALTVFGDLDVSSIDEVPEGRKRVETTLLEPPERQRAYDCVREEVGLGHQAYVVYPTIDVSDIHVESAEEAYRRLREDLTDMTVGILHGRMSNDEKDGVIQRFRRGAIDVLVATTVIGVGVDVPNATVMIVEGADRFGLADLHQLRGRVGRGDAASQCFLIPREGASEDSIGRLHVLARTTDGFQIAEADLVQRGMGDLAGAKQAGLPSFRVTDLARDTDLLLEARDAARDWVAKDPKLRRHDSRVAKMVLDARTVATRDASSEAG